MFYQAEPSNGRRFNIFAIDPEPFAMHLHRDFELHFCTEGTLYYTNAQGAVAIDAGEALLFFPHQPHGVSENKDGHGYVSIFEPELVGSFYRQTKNLLPETNRMRFSYDVRDLRSDSDLFSIKAFLYSACAAAVRDMRFLPRNPEQETALLDKILVFVEQHYRENCTLLAVSKSLKYDYSYLSRYFIRRIGIPFNEYVNRRRIADAVSSLEKGSPAAISEIAAECGYDSIRSFNRNFKKICGKKPNEFLRSINR